MLRIDISTLCYGGYTDRIGNVKCYVTLYIQGRRILLNSGTALTVHVVKHL